MHAVEIIEDYDGTVTVTLVWGVASANGSGLEACVLRRRFESGMGQVEFHTIDSHSVDVGGELLFSRP
jgi:hypothetical protein